jgi:hypothetical protein
LEIQLTWTLLCSSYLPCKHSYAHSLDRIETSPLHATHQLLSYLTSKSGSFTFQGSQAAIFTSSAHIPTFLASPPPFSSSTSSEPAPQRLLSTTANPPPANPYSSANPLWTSSLDPAEIPDLEILPLPMRYHCSLDDGKPEGKTKDLRAGKYDKSKGYFTPIVVLVDPKSKGSVTVKSKDPRDEPVADPGFRTSMLHTLSLPCIRLHTQLVRTVVPSEKLNDRSPSAPVLSPSRSPSSSLRPTRPRNPYLWPQARQTSRPDHGFPSPLLPHQTSRPKLPLQ